jgi:hypothetical protein
MTSSGHERRHPAYEQSVAPARPEAEAVPRASTPEPAPGSAWRGFLPTPRRCPSTGLSRSPSLTCTHASDPLSASQVAAISARTAEREAFAPACRRRSLGEVPRRQARSRSSDVPPWPACLGVAGGRPRMNGCKNISRLPQSVRLFCARDSGRPAPIPRGGRSCRRRLPSRLGPRGTRSRDCGVGVGVVEGVHCTAGRDLDLQARAGRQVADGELYSIAIGVPEEEDFVGAAHPPGQFSSRRAHAFAPCGLRAAVVFALPARRPRVMDSETRSESSRRPTTTCTTGWAKRRWARPTRSRVSQFERPSR